MSHSLACDAGAHGFAAVALVKAIPGKDLLTYRVAEADRGGVRPGVRVLVPIGRRHETGVVVELTGAPPPGVETVRAIIDVLDDEPILTPELFALCRWAADYYLTTLADVLAAALPGGLRASSTRIIRLIAPGAPTCGPEAARGLEAAIVTHLAAAGPTSIITLARALGGRRVAGAVRALAARAVVAVEEQLRAPVAKTRFEHGFALTRALDADEAAALGRRAPSQRALYDRIVAADARRLAAQALTPRERVAATALVRRGVVVATRRERYRDPTPGAARDSAPLTLTTAQEAAVGTIVGSSGFQVFLLHGVTGSGKTEVYLQAAARTQAKGQSVLFLVPEIALTHQLVRRVQERFGAGVALLHSGLGPGERWDEWRRVARGEARMVVGARSAVFAPLADLGLVIVDEEHDPAYKQDEGLRYNARDLAIVRAKLAGAGAILGSATPSIESYQQALDGKFRLLSLPRRVEGRPLPTVQILDLRTDGPVLAIGKDADGRRTRASGTAELPSSMLLSPRLVDAIAETLARREQTLLFLNRRGFARVLQCVGCGEPAGCPSCSVSLTLHERRAVLLCHHCGFARPARSPCTSCGRDALRASVEGTERIEVDVASRFPDARVGRLDRDTTGSKGAQRRILEAWEAGDLDVLIGTQMVAKGHDVPGVTLVGVLLADVALNMPDFRAAERAFQLLTQVAGRAGRGARPGRVLIQTYRPTHHSLVAAAAHDYASFAPDELAHRREVAYPPFARLIVLRLEGVGADATEHAATTLAAAGRGLDPRVTLRGPAPAPLERLRNRYRWQILLASTSVRALHRVVRHLLTFWRATRTARTVRLIVDVDPVSML
ncbi:MAG: primosomal protein N' [Deltaproteobacteria bacterium]|nr:primosomal protein N' [Deltaproteobacteria bacterium]